MHCGALIYEILRHTDFNSQQTRNQAATLIYVLLRRNFQERNNVSRSKLQLTIATERMVNLLIKDSAVSSDVHTLRGITDRKVLNSFCSAAGYACHALAQGY